MITPTATFSDDQATTDTRNCGNYDIAPALEFRRLYDEALAAKDYERLKELKRQKDETDLWAKTDVPCEPSEGQEASVAQNENEEQPETSNQEQEASGVRARVRSNLRPQARQKKALVS